MQEEEEKPHYFRGRGAQINTSNKFLKNRYEADENEDPDDPLLSDAKTQIFYEHPKKIINVVKSPDLIGMYSMNPYQGCEHGCIYCYARNTHEYWGYSAGLDFERKIIAKPNAPALMEKHFMNKNWQVAPIMFSGNTDCYQPIERKLKITRQMLEVLLKFRHPAGMITKNSLILRDIDILQELAKLRLVHVMVSITSLREELRLKMEPRTATAKNRLKVIEQLNKAGVPAGIMTAPIIPGLNSDEIPDLIKAAADHGADTAGYTIVRLNGSIGDIFKDWIRKNYPDRAEKVLHHIENVHDGTLNDSRFGTRMRGEGNIAQSINQLFKLSVKKHLAGRDRFDYDLTAFRRPGEVQQLELF
ncbi:MAG: family radical protein [Bacteroidota bacterium]|jgi:DNA repair photolyase|nr:family radical protein [Bacteroidota bacterium]